MESPEDIEKALAALVPSALSEKGQRALDDLIDNLAAGNAPLAEMETPVRRRLAWGWIGGLGAGAAAAVTLAFQVPGGPKAGLEGPVSGPVAGVDEAIAPVDEAGVVSLARTYVNQERVRDVKTGYEVLVTCVPAEEDSNSNAVPPLAETVLAVPNSGSDTAGLGFAMGVLDDSSRAYIPDLKRGFGLLITTVERGGPYEKAGVMPDDILWKIGDQWIANKAQVLTLLQLHKEGDEVKLGIYRSGKALDIPVVLGSFPDELRAQTLALGSARSKDGELDMPMNVRTPNNVFREAPDGKAMLTRRGGALEVKIVSNSGSIVYEGPVYDDRGAYLIPEAWQANVGALERVFNNRVAGRPARLRAVPVRQEAGDK